MKNIISRFIISVFAASLFSSCEDVIDIPLKNSDSKIVIEAKINNEPGGCIVKLTRIVSYKEPNVFHAVIGA